ncbi:MAG: type I methionyl aminopeptidase [Deltaproteobacteria bacterium]|jgi:methionyl aminopeptidase|nr:type I methionyl aminopeptidase [Deltaproteobacteria bacterium]MDP7157155.1 methionyl aminopeptidase [SAR324 cluster bacterium]
MRTDPDPKSLSRNDPCWCGSGKKYKKCHWSQDRTAPPSPSKWGTPRKNRKIILKTEAQVEGIRCSCQLTKKLLDMLEGRVCEGVRTIEIDEWVHAETLAHGATPAPLGYRGFPKSVCTSVNHVICHGIPDNYALRNGDIINIDVTCVLDGYYGDASRMYLIGEVSDEARKLVEVTKECLDLGIQTVKPFNTVGDLGHVIQQHAEGHGYSVVRDFAGHGVGIEFHEAPQILHYGEPRTGTSLQPNMVFTIEPMINAGRAESHILADKWTAVTVDGSLSAQWEHTVRVTPSGVEVLSA